MTDSNRITIVKEVYLRNGQKMFRFADDNKLRHCTTPCHSAALKQGIGAGDEVEYSIDSKDLISYMKTTGKHFDVNEKPAAAVEIPPAQNHPASTTDRKEPDRMFLETHRQELITMEFCINAGIRTVAMSGHPGDFDVETNEEEIHKSAERYYDYLMSVISRKRGDQP